MTRVEEFGDKPDIPKIIREHAIGTRDEAINSSWRKIERFTIACAERTIDDVLETFGEDIRIMKLKELNNTRGLVKESFRHYDHLLDNHDYHLHSVEYFYDMAKISFRSTEDAAFEFVMQHAPDTFLLSPEESRREYEARLKYMLLTQKNVSKEILGK